MKKIYYLIAMAFMALTFTSCEDVPEPYGKPVSPKKETVDPAGSGSVSDPYNVAGAIAKCKEIGDVESNEKFYIKGYAATEGKADASFGNASFYMTDFKDGSGKRFYAYQVAGSDGQKMKEGYTIKVGDEVVIYGKITYFSNKTPETVGKGAAYIVSVNGEKTEAGGGGSGGEAKGTGTLEDPFNAAAANLEAAKLASGTTSDKQYYIKGKVAKIPSNANYGEGKYPTTANYYISDDGEDANTFYIYASKYLGNKDYTEGAVLKVGDEVIVCGNITNYNGTYETAQNKNYLYSLNGENEGGGGTPSETLGTKDNPLNVAKALEYISALADNAKTDKFAYVKGTIKTIKTKDEDIAKYKNIDYIITDGTNDVTVFRGKNLDNTDFTAAGQINVGDEVIVYGQLTKYVKNDAVTPEVAQGNYLVSLKSGSGGGGGTSGPYLEEAFAEGQGAFTIENKTLGEGLTFVWKHDSSNKYMKASGYASANKESESWLISPEINLSSATNPVLTFAQVINKYFGTVADEAMVYVKKDGGEWTKVSISYPTITSGNWSKFTDDGANQSVNLSSFKSSKTRVAFVYKSSTSAAGTWEIKNVVVDEAK